MYVIYTYIYICIYVYVYTYNVFCSLLWLLDAVSYGFTAFQVNIYLYLSIYIHIYLYIYLYLSIYLSIYISIYLSIYLSISIYIYIYMYIYIYIYIYTYLTSTCRSFSLYMYISIQSSALCSGSSTQSRMGSQPSRYISISISIYLYIYIYIYIYIYLSIYIYLLLYMYMYIYIHSFPIAGDGGVRTWLHDLGARLPLAAPPLLRPASPPHRPHRTLLALALSGLGRLPLRRGAHLFIHLHLYASICLSIY